MSEHYSRNTTGVLRFCNTCNKQTLHHVSGKEVGLCTNDHSADRKPFAGQGIPGQIDLFAGPPKPAQILALPDVKEWVEERVAIMVFDGHQEEDDAVLVARGRAVKLFNQGYFGI